VDLGSWLQCEKTLEMSVNRDSEPELGSCSGVIFGGLNVDCGV
jgi:hypothetical protein